jgi:hypothetical protein
MNVGELAFSEVPRLIFLRRFSCMGEARYGVREAWAAKPRHDEPPRTPSRSACARRQGEQQRVGAPEHFVATLLATPP